MLEKLKSRKFITAVAGIILGIAMVFGLDTDAITQVAGAVTALASVITYIYTEGKIDAAAVHSTVEIIQGAAEAIDETE